MLELLHDVKIDSEEEPTKSPLGGAESTFSSQLLEKIIALKGSGTSSVAYVKRPQSKGFHVGSDGGVISDDEMPLPRVIMSDNGEPGVAISHDGLSRNMKSAATYNRPANGKMSRAQTNAQYRRTYLSQHQNDTETKVDSNTVHDGVYSQSSGDVLPMFVRTPAHVAVTKSVQKKLVQNIVSLENQAKEGAQMHEQECPDG